MISSTWKFESSVQSLKERLQFRIGNEAHLSGVLANTLHAIFDFS